MNDPVNDRNAGMTADDYEYLMRRRRAARALLEQMERSRGERRCAGRMSLEQADAFSGEFTARPLRYLGREVRRG